MAFTLGPKKKGKAKKATSNPERFSTTKAGKRLHKSEEKRLKQPKKVVKGKTRKPSLIEGLRGNKKK